MRASEIAETLAAELRYQFEAADSIQAHVRYARRNLTRDGRKRVLRIGPKRDVRWSLA